MSITIDKEFESLIPPLTDEEFQQLEENCVKEGIRDALITWNGILIDGHNRFKISAKHGLHWTEKKMDFADRNEAIAWIIDNQLGRRNLHVLDREALLAKKQETLKRLGKPISLANLRHSTIEVENLPHRETGKTRDIIGKELGISGRQVDKIHVINEKASPEVKQQIREGKKSINGAFNEIKEQERKKLDVSAKAHIEEAEERHRNFQDSKTVSISDVAQNKKDVSDIARNKVGEIHNAIKKILFIGATDIDYSIINKKTVDETTIISIETEIDMAIKILTIIKDDIGG